MTTLPTLSIPIPTKTFHKNPIQGSRCHLYPKSQQPIKAFCMGCTKIGSFHENWSKMSIWGYRDKGYLFGLKMGRKDGILWGYERLRREKRVVLVKFNQGFGFNGGDNNNRGGRKIDGNTTRVLTNLALAVGLTYLSMTDQLGGVLDAIVSLWLLAIILPVVGIGVFLWWAGQDMIQSTCPNCGNEFQVFKSSLNDELQLCPFCSQPFSVEGNEFVKEPINFSSKRSPFEQIFDGFRPPSGKGKGKDTSTTIVDVEAEVKDAD